MSKEDRKYNNNDKRFTNRLERIFESSLWSTRFLVILAVISTLFASLALFVIGSMDIFKVLKSIFSYYFSSTHTLKNFHSIVVAEIIGAIDVYLIAVVLLIFSFGLYELFISRIDAASKSESSSILKIYSLSSLKDKIAQVIIMALIVKYFQMVLLYSSKFKSAYKIIFLAGSILALAIALFFMHKSRDSRQE